MKVAFFSTKSYDRQSFEAVNANYNHELTFFDVQLNSKTAILAAESPAVCMFVNDIADAATLDILASHGTHLLALRSGTSSFPHPQCFEKHCCYDIIQHHRL